MERFALLARHRIGDGLCAGAQDVGGPAHQLGAVEGRRLPPEREALVGRFQREIEVGVTRMGDAADHLLGRRIDDRDSLRSQGVAPFAADEKPYVRIGMHEINRCSTLWRAGGLRPAAFSRVRRTGEAEPLRRMSSA
ncbi:UNVERIFIED_ORG: hypothetical protein GGE44_003913 [Rhizobium esperanzae]